MRGVLAVVILLLFAAPAGAAPRLLVGGTLWPADGAVVGNDPLTVVPLAPGARVAVTVDGAPLSRSRVDPRRYGDGPHPRGRDRDRRHGRQQRSGQRA